MPGLYMHKAVGSLAVRQLVCVHCICCVTYPVVQDARCLVHAVGDSGVCNRESTCYRGANRAVCQCNCFLMFNRTTKAWSATCHSCVKEMFLEGLLCKSVQHQWYEERWH